MAQEIQETMQSAPNMKVLVVGATGRTGIHVVSMLLEKGHEVSIIVRSPAKLSQKVANHPKLKITEASILDLSKDELLEAAKDAKSIVSCLGHVLSCKGVCGKPRDLCTEASRRLSDCAAAIGAKFILMNTVGVNNPDLKEPRTCCEGCILCCLRCCVPPHADNENANAYVHGLGNTGVEWCIVRPDSLIEEDAVSAYEIFESPTRTIFDGMDTSRINVAAFMVTLIKDQDLWDKWKFRMPVIVNKIEVVEL